MRPTRVLACLTLTASLGLLAGCGGEDDPEVAPASGTAAADEEGAPDVEAGADEAEVDAEAPGEVVDICSVVTTADIDAIVGGSTILAPVPGGGCSFNQEDPRATSVSLGSMEFSEDTGGFEAAQSGITALIEGEVVDVDLGDEAFVVVGPSFGGSSEQGGGLIRVGSTLVQVTVIQSVDLTADEVATVVTDVLTLVESKA